jgi:hypothetical protein
MGVGAVLLLAWAACGDGTEMGAAGCVASSSAAASCGAAASGCESTSGAVVAHSE